MKKPYNDLKAMRTARSGAVGYTTVANAMPASRDAAPYLGQTHVGGSYNQDDVARRIAASKGCQFGVEEIKRVWNAVGNYLLDRMPEELCAFDIGFARVRPAIGGSFPSMDAPFDAERNRVYVAVTPSDAIRDAVAGSSPVREGEAGDEPEVGNVTWDGVASQTIKSGEPFQIYGNALTLNVGDESAELRLPGGAGTVEVTVSAVAEGNWQRLNGSLAHAVEPCEGAKLVVKTHGYDPESGLKVVKSKPLTVLAGGTPPADPPVATSYESEGMEGEPVTLNGGSVKVNGTNLAGATKIAFRYAEDGEPFYEAYVTDESETTAECAQLGYAGTVTGENGFLSVITPSGESNKLACTFTA